MAHSNRSLSKKRKPELDLDAEKTMFGAFQQAASAVSSLYTLAAQQQRKSRDAGARQALERVASWVFTQYAGSAVVPTAALLEFLRQEMQDCAGNDAADFPVAFPAPALPVPPGYEVHGSDENMLGDQCGLRRGAGGMQISPPKRGSSTSLHSQQQQQQLFMQQHQQQQQQAQQQQLQGFSFPGP